MALLPPSDQPEGFPISVFCEHGNLRSSYTPRDCGEDTARLSGETRIFVSPAHTIGESLQVRRLVDSLACVTASLHLYIMFLISKFLNSIHFY